MSYDDDGGGGGNNAWIGWLVLLLIGAGAFILYITTGWIIIPIPRR